MSGTGLDWDRLKLPSDGLTLGAIRAMHRNLFTAPSHGISEPLIRVLAFDILSSEMELAELAFARAAGRTDPGSESDRHELIQTLIQDYAKVGIGSGDTSRRLLIRQIESDAAAMAQTPGLA